MPADAASSSSEDEGNDSSSPGSTPAKQSKQATKKSTRYQCPADFVTFRHQPCSSTLKANLMVDNTELWLIKAPASFNPKCFNNVKVPISGLQTIKASSTVGEDEGGCHQIYSVLASAHGVSALHLLTSDSKSANKVACAPAFRGLLNVCESYGDCSSNQAPQAIPAAPAPCIPLGLKLRFQPFGSKTPTVSTLEDSESLGDCEEEPDPLAAVAGTLDGTMWTASSATLPPLLPPTITQRLKEERKKKKKKRKRDKRMEEDEKEAVVMVKMEPAKPGSGVSTVLPAEDGE
ncbi:DNA-directed RNA polymerase I subunit RPA34 [Aplochiton taeniatus]